jgi:putative spermidine/putrescine transport system substrate-binding protein
MRLIARTVVSAAAAIAAFAMVSAPALAKELRILAWEGYADPDWVKDFESTCACTVKVVFIGTDDEIWAKIKGSEGKDFDLFAVNTAQLQRYIDAGLTTPYDLAKMPNQKDVLPRFQDLSKVTGVMRDGKVMAIPSAFDSIGIIYDTDKVKEAPTSWNVLWDPQYAGKVLGYDNGEHNFTIAALTMGIEDPFRLTDDQLKEAEAKLIKMKQNVLSFYTTADEALQLYQHNDIAIILANFGQQQVKTMQAAGAHIAYVNPSEGSPAWLDTWAMTSGVQDKDLAESWVNFVLQKKIGQQLSERTGFGNTVAPFDSAKPNDKLVWLKDVEDPTKRADLWNEVKASP